MEEVIAKIFEVLGTIEGMSATLAIVLEFGLRLLPTKKPLSILHIAAKSIRLVSDVLEKAADVMDKVLPQNNQ
jgi:hypothetical protein